jgi:hypothetical protein
LSGADIAGMLAKAGFKYLFNVEDKYDDVNVATTVNSTGFVMLLNGLVQGTTVSTRIGDSVRFVRSVWNYSFTVSLAATTTFVRLIMFRDSQPDGAAPNAFVNLLMSSSYNALYNPNYANRFYVYYDVIHALNSQSDQTIVKDGSTKMGFHTRYGLGNAGTVADISTNSYYLLAISDQATNVPNLSLNVRMMFVDN